MKPLKDITTPENALLSNTLLDEILDEIGMSDKKLKSYSTDDRLQVRTAKGLYKEVLGIHLNINKIPEVDVIYEYAMQTDVDIDILRSKLGCIILPYFLLAEKIKNINAKLAENALSELSNNILKLLKSERSILVNGSDYLIERLRLEDPLPSSTYYAKERIYIASRSKEERHLKDTLFKAFIVNLIETAEKEMKKDT